MSGLAKYLLQSGKTVAGSDIAASVYVEDLINSGIEVDIGGVRSVGGFDAVVYTDAIPQDEGRLVEARVLGKPVFSRGQLLYEISKDFKRVIAVSGCHGKTTCTAMLAHIFSAANKKFGVHLGGRDIKFNNFYCSGKDIFITEACEYKKNFLLLQPDIAVVLNDRADHLECYGSYEKLLEAYKIFCNQAETSVTLNSDKLSGTVTFGYGRNAAYSARDIAQVNGKYTFTVTEEGQKLGKIALKVYGKHNVLNALAATAASRLSGIAFEDIAVGLNGFSGVERRFESLGTFGGAEYIADYAHHPDEIKEAVSTAKKFTKGRIFTVFQPHTYSRTKNLFNDFVKTLSSAGNLLIYKTFPAREFFDDAGSALTLALAVKNCVYGDCAYDVKNFVMKAGEGDTVLFLGAGDIYTIAKEVAKTL